MKKMMLTAAVAVAAQAAFAQITIAPEAGLNIAKAAVSDDADFSHVSSLLGPKLGVYANMPLAKGFFFQPGLLYSPKGFKVTETETISGVTATATIKVRAAYLEVPLNLGYAYSLGKAGKIFVTAGPYIGYGLGGKIKTTVTVLGQTISDPGSDDIKVFGSKEDALFKRADFGLNFGLGYQLPMGLYARFQYGMGLINIVNNDGSDASIKNKCMAFSVGYAFKIGK